MSAAAPEPFQRLLRSWSRHLAAANKSPATIKLYVGAGELLGAFLAQRDGPADPSKVERAHVEGFIADLLAKKSASTAGTRYRGLQQFFKWLVLEEEIERSPMEGMKPPKLDEKPVPVVGDHDLSALLKACGGKGFENRRDLAIVRVFLDTGIRAGEMAGLRVKDVDLDQRLVVVTGKGRRTRGVGLGMKATKDLDRYIERERPAHPLASVEALWLGNRMPLQASGIAQMLRRRCDQAGIPRIHPHQLRHTFAHLWLAQGGGERDLMSLAGWKSPQMLGRYGASLAAERAREAHQRIAPGDRL